MYDFKSRVRYSEVNSDRQMTVPALVDYLQNCCSFQSEDMNIGVDYLEKHQVAWVLSSWEIQVKRYPDFAEMVTVSTIILRAFMDIVILRSVMRQVKFACLPTLSGFS